MERTLLPETLLHARKHRSNLWNKVFFFVPDVLISSISGNSTSAPVIPSSYKDHKVLSVVYILTVHAIYFETLYPLKYNELNH